jgi:hypothetical protein
MGRMATVIYVCSWADTVSDIAFLAFVPFGDE